MRQSLDPGLRKQELPVQEKSLINYTSIQLQTCFNCLLHRKRKGPYVLLTICTSESKLGEAAGEESYRISREGDPTSHETMVTVTF